ncbi:MAG TPA: GNAT family N-acetyltransferase [Rhizomicrobium sp.]|jgi:ribosomal-protein-alanine N-acetyltransferase|nr:GNAT family N-acetyltransferase [Rhizomicrobium sp.]
MRLADQTDCGQLAHIHATSFEDCWNEASLRDLLGSPGVFALIEVESFILIRAAADEAEILTLAVAPEKRRGGMARALVEAAAAEAHRRGAQACFLEVNVANEAARALYTGLGFAEAGRRPAYYRSAKGSADALILKVALPLGKLVQLD